MSQEQLDPAIYQHRELRRILAAFIVVIILMPIVALGGKAGMILLLPLLATAAFAARSAIRLRRSVRAQGDARGR